MKQFDAMKIMSLMSSYLIHALIVKHIYGHDISQEDYDAKNNVRLLHFL